jgi:hypothetical protein
MQQQQQQEQQQQKATAKDQAEKEAEAKEAEEKKRELPPHIEKVFLLKKKCRATAACRKGIADRCVLILLYMRHHTAMYVSAYCCVRLYIGRERRRVYRSRRTQQYEDTYIAVRCSMRTRT